MDKICYDYVVYILPEYSANKSLGDNLCKFTSDKEKYIFEMERKNDKNRTQRRKMEIFIC